jgi:hypothetical protein
VSNGIVNEQVSRKIIYGYILDILKAVKFNYVIARAGEEEKEHTIDLSRLPEFGDKSIFLK